MSIQINKILQETLLFASLSPTQWDLLKTGILCRDVEKNHTLFHQGQPFTHFYFLHDGLIKLALITMAGDEKIVHIIRSGETFATALMFLDRKVYPVTAQALQLTQVVAIDAALFRKVLMESPKVCMSLLGEMSQRLNGHLSSLSHSCQRNAQSRVARYLLEQVPHDPYGHHLIHLEFPKQILASLLSITPETLSRILGEFEKKKIISMHNRQIQILNLELLKRKGGACASGAEMEAGKSKINHELFV
ncbi:MAG: Crp/Fnr family transcriptional regulator [Magnetococcales bacterium]|nr:Crp/Fnr family transcriptional regulator [Magnetococcales bacterium]